MRDLFSSRSAICPISPIPFWVVLVLGLRVSLLFTEGQSVAGAGFQVTELTVPLQNKTGFSLLSPAQTEVFFTNALAMSRSITNHVLLNGSGVAAGDVDGDGWVDLYFCGLDAPNRLYRNLGNWRFKDITEAAGVACADLDGTGAVLADIDGDRDLDLIVNSIGTGTRVFMNDGLGRFLPAPKSPLLNQRQAGTSMALADMDGDGALDLYIANYRPMFFFLDKPETRYSIRTINGQPRVAMIDGRPLTDPEFTNRFVFNLHISQGKVTLSKEELGQVDAFYRNDGKGGFTLIPFTGGAFLDEDGKPLTDPPRDWGLSVMFRDLNADGFPDLYVCNDFRTPDRIWLSDGRGSFRALPRLAMRQTCLSAMGVDVADFNRDGHFDIVVADMLSTEHSRRLIQRIDLRPESMGVGEIDTRPQFSRNMLQLNRGDGTFAEMAQLAGLQAAEWAWSPIFLDVDLDGFEDLLVANGFERDTMNVDAQKRFESVAHQQKLTGLERLKLRKLFPRLDTPNLAFRNLGDGRFENVSVSWAFDTAVISQGMCLADLDNDGDLDVIVNNMNAPAGLYRNNSPAPRMAVRLKGLPPNTRGIGAKIEVLGGPVYQSQEMICGGRYCSSDDFMRTFAAGGLTNELKLIVTWRSGKQSVLFDVKANRLYEIDEAFANATGPLVTAPGVPSVTSRGTPAFRDVSGLLNHIHHEQPFDDFERQPLLPVKLSQLGPGVAWFDLDQDGWDDLIIGSGRGGRLGLYRNNRAGGFEPYPNATAAGFSTRDQAAILGWHKGPDSTALIVATPNYEDGQSGAASAIQIDWGRQTITDAVPGHPSSTGPMAFADIDGDGDLDLFVGGRVVPGRYPHAAVSRLFRNEKGAFQLDATNALAFASIGLVSGAVFTDLDQDGDPDLVLACDWGPIRVFHNHIGRFSDATRQLRLDGLKGWWTGVNVGDFDGDGRLDIVAANWGRNSKYEQARQQPLRIFYGDFNGDGGVQTLEAFFDTSSRKLVPWRRLDDIARAVPSMNATFTTFEQFATAGIQDILGDKLAKANVLEATWLESTVFLNRHTHFEPAPLPFEAQLAPAFAVCVADLDGDGNEDLFLSQNFFGVPIEMSRYDAGRSLLLRGDGRGQFQPISGSESGLLVYGEQRGAALCDYDADGRVDLVVTQNGATTKLFHNETARPGLRVRLKGAPANPAAIGAVLRLVSGDQSGPAREIHAGSGYWSQDAAVQVLALPAGRAHLQIRWPSGTTTETHVLEDAREIEVDPSGRLRLMR